MKKIITVLLSVLLIAGLFTGCNGDATSALVNNSVDTTITMSLGNVDETFLNELKEAVNAETISLYWYVLGTKPGSDENDKLLEITEKFSFDNPTFSREVSFEADNPAMFGLAIDEPDAEPLPDGALDKFNEWMAGKVGKELPISWKITGHKINESGTENLKIEEINEKYLIKYMKLNEETLRMTDTPTGVEETVTLISYMVQPVAVKIGHSSVSKYSEGSRGTDEAPIEITAPEKRYLWGGESLYKELIDGDYSPETTPKENFIDRFSKRTMDNVFIFEDGTDGPTMVAAAEAEKLIVVPGANLGDFIKYVTSGEGDGAPYSYIPYGYDLSELDTSEFYLYFAMKKIKEDGDLWDTYFSYSDFSLWDEVDGKPTDEEVRKSMVVDFQNEIDDYASFIKGEHATPSGSRDVTKALENELSAVHIRYKMSHFNGKLGGKTDLNKKRLFVTSTNTIVGTPLKAGYEWTRIRNGQGSSYTHGKVRNLDFNTTYGEWVSSSRDITLWVIHDVKKGEHLYVIKDQPDYDFHSVFISDPANKDTSNVLPICQMICNNRWLWDAYGAGSSGSTQAKGLEWYGDSGWMETRVIFTDGVSRNNDYAFGNVAPVTTQTIVTKTDSINFGISGGFGWTGKFNANIAGSFGISHTTSEAIPEVTVFYEGKTGEHDPVVRWRYVVRDDFYCRWSLFYHAMSKYVHGPSNTSISNLKPPMGLYTISVADEYVNKVGLKFNSGFRFKRKAFKGGTETCIGLTDAASEASFVLPYDKDPAHYGGKLPW